MVRRDGTKFNAALEQLIQIAKEDGRLAEEGCLNALMSSIYVGTVRELLGKCCEVVERDLVARERYAARLTN